MRFILFCIFFSYGMLSPAQDRLPAQADSLLAGLKKPQRDTERVNTLINLSDQFISSEPGKALDYAIQAQKLAEKIKWGKGVARSYHFIGYYYYTQDDRLNTLENWQKALDIYQALKDKAGISRTLGNIGSVYKEQGDYPKALDHYFRVLKMAEELGNKSLVALWLGNIGNVYKEQANYSTAIGYYQRALKIGEELGDKTRIAAQLGNIGIVYADQGNYPKALDYYFRSLKMDEVLQNKRNIAADLGNIGIVYHELGNSDKTESSRQANYSIASDYYFKALKLKEEIGDKTGVAVWLDNIGSLYTQMGKFGQAEAYLKKSLFFSDTLGDLEGVKEANYDLFLLYNTTGRHKLALTHYKKFIAVSDSIYSDENQKKQVQTEMTYEFEKRQAFAKAEQEKKEAVTTAESRRQRIILLSMSGLVVLVLGFAVFAWRSFLQKKKANEAISKQKHLIEEKQKEILDSIYYARRIQRSLLTSEKFIQRKITDLNRA